MVAGTRISRLLLIGKKTRVTDVYMVDSAVETMASPGLNHLLYLPWDRPRRGERVRASYGHVDLTEIRLTLALRTWHNFRRWV